MRLQVIGQKFVYRFVTFPEGGALDTLQYAVARDIDNMPTESAAPGSFFTFYFQILHTGSKE